MVCKKCEKVSILAELDRTLLISAERLGPRCS